MLILKQTYIKQYISIIHIIMAQTLSAQKQYTNGSITSLTPGCECLGPAANRHGMSQS